MKCVENLALSYKFNSYMYEIQIFVQCGSCFTNSAPDYNSSITTTRLLLPLLEQLNIRSSRHKAHNFSCLNIMKNNPAYAYSQSIRTAHFSCKVVFES